MIGKTLGHYEILEPLGAGGMGEVYLGRDPPLDRKVAIKVLPAEFASDPERLARFEQEAKAAAALNHPHIAAVFDIGFEDGNEAAEAATDPNMDISAIPAAGVHYIVQEYLQGETLSAPLARGALPIKKALALATEIGEALGAAHEAGIIHRDLKPANVFITKDGHAKVLDFGLAKLTEVAPAGDGSASMSPTLLGTVAGQVMGTAGYMAPEQAAGATDIDHRADLFAFGSLLYEMVSGQRAFAGRSIAETLSLIQHEQPSSITQINGALPAELDRIVGKAIAKDPADRYQHTDDLVVDLRALARQVDSGTAVPAAATMPTGRRGGISSALAIPLLAVVAILAGLAGRSLPPTESTPPLPEMHFSLEFPEGVVGIPRGTGLALGISRDGQTIAFVGHDELGTRRLYVRRLGDLASVPIAGTEHAMTPKLSPDGDWIGFSYQLGTSERILLAGGEPFEVCTSCWDVNGADDGNLYFQDAGTLYRMPAAGGDRKLLSGPRPEQGLSRFARLHPLPGSSAILFENSNYEFGGIGVFSLEDDRVVHISPDGSEPLYSTTGHILFTRRGTLFAVPFDAEDLVVTGPEKPVLQGVRVENAGAAQVALAANGTLVYQPAEGPQRTQLVWVDRTGQMEVAVAERKNYAFPRISPVDAKAAVVVNENGSTDVWIVDLATGSQRQLTTVGSARSPTWTPAGTAVAFGAGSEGAYTLRLANATSGADEELLASEHPLSPMDFTPDGRPLVFMEASTTQDIFVLDIDDRTRRALFTTEAAESAASLSGDGKWLAYDSNRTGGREVYVRQFPDGDEIQVSTTAGRFPMWSMDGSELFYQAELNRIFAAAFRTDTVTFGLEPDLTPQNGSRGNLTIWVKKGRSECRRRGTAQSRSYGSYGRLRWSWPEARRSRMPAAS